MRVLGLSAFYHDSAVALVEDGVIVAAAQEERFTRIKHDAAFPHHALSYCLQVASGPPDAVVYYEKPLRKFERILSTAFAEAPRGFRAFSAAIPAWLHTKLWIPYQIESAFAARGIDVSRQIYFAEHHEAHAASVFLPSPFRRAAILTLDGVGEWATTTLGRGEDHRIEFLRELRFPHSLGLLYSAFTDFCGFRVNSGEYKLMGLAPYGTPRFRQLIFDQLLDLKADGSFRLNLDYFGFLRGQRMTNRRFADLFGGPARNPDSPLTARECDLARSIQEVTEEIVLRLAHTLHALTGETNLCLAGGVALNCVANARILREGPFENLWIQPAAGDAGGALGAALAYYHLEHGAPRPHIDRSVAAPTSDAPIASNSARAVPHPDRGDAMRGAFLGPSFSDEEIAAVLSERGIVAERLPSVAALAERIAGCIARGAVVGVHHGRSEFGPRALGHRSILADPRSAEMQRTLNLKIKFRESFRPFAPSVLAERAREFFELETPSPYMLLTAPVQPSKRRATAPTPEGDFLAHLNQPRSEIPAVTHLDHSARVQTVTREENPFLHAVISAFDRITGCPLLINTSFNVRGEPPVSHPREALDGFLHTGMDALALGSFFLEKSTLDPRHLPASPRQFSPD